MKIPTYSALAFSMVLLLGAMHAQSAPNIHTATLGETSAKTPEVSTLDMRRILADKSATVFDVRPAMEFATSHIPGALNVAQKPGTSKALYVSDAAEIGRLLGGDKTKAIVLYCNGPYCGKSKRVSEDLLAAGFTNVRRYQLGMPVWRALGGISQIEPAGAKYVMQNDRTAVWLDTRPASAIASAPLPGAKPISIDIAQGKDNAVMQRAKNDGTLPMEDHNARIIVFGDDAKVVRVVAGAIAEEAFDNVAFFGGPAAELVSAVK